MAERAPSKPASNIEYEYREAAGELSGDFDNAFQIAVERGKGDLAKEFRDFVKEIAKKRGQAVAEWTEKHPGKAAPERILTLPAFPQKFSPLAYLGEIPERNGARYHLLNPVDVRVGLFRHETQLQIPEGLYNQMTVGVNAGLPLTQAA